MILVGQASYAQGAQKKKDLLSKVRNFLKLQRNHRNASSNAYGKEEPKPTFVLLL